MFQQGFDNYTEIFIVNSDVSGLTQLTSNTANDAYPSLSDSGENLVFVSNGDIYIVNHPSDESGSDKPINMGSVSTFPSDIIVVSGIIVIASIALIIAYLKRK